MIRARSTRRQSRRSLRGAMQPRLLRCPRFSLMYKGFRRGAIDPRNRSDSTVMTNDAAASPAPDPGDTPVGDTASSAEAQRDVRLGQQGDVPGAGDIRDSTPRPRSAAHEPDADYPRAAALYTSGQLSQAEQICLTIVRQRGR